MIVYEFYLKEIVKAQALENIYLPFLEIGPKITRKIDGAIGSAIYSVSRNPSTNWVQFLVDDNTSSTIQEVIETKIKELCDTTFVKYSDPHDNIAPIERKREIINI